MAFSALGWKALAVASVLVSTGAAQAAGIQGLNEGLKSVKELDRAELEHMNTGIDMTPNEGVAVINNPHMPPGLSISQPNGVQIGTNTITSISSGQTGAAAQGVNAMPALPVVGGLPLGIPLGALAGR